ncbi:MAG: glycogen debranching enzyme family protein [Planctomycetes bacterium]|nr:glycogen debranching enzyme family protein [Planctomycetota bacterium]
MDTQTTSPNPSSTGFAPIRMDRAACLRMEQALFREWLEADGMGGYASSTVHLCPTRRYHGLLVAPLPGGGERHVFVSRLEEELVGPNRSFPLSTGRYPGIYAPEGYQSIASFELDPYPTWHYQIGEVEVQREILAVWGQHTVLVRWTRKGGPAGLRLRLRPLLAFRRSHDLTHENVALDPRATRLPQGLVVRPYPALPAATMGLDAPGFQYEADPVWYRKVEYLAELRRGFAAHEDLFSPGRIEVDFPDGQPIYFVATLGETLPDPAALWAEEQAFRKQQAEGVQSFRDRLILASDTYFYKDTHGRPGVIAGFPWFGEWGRDTFLALPGLTLPAGRLDLCHAVLVGALPFLRDGLLPNIYGADVASSSYQSADAALWFTRAVLLYQHASEADEAVWNEFGAALESIAEAYLRGTDLGLRVDERGRLHAGSPTLNATWMDAMVHGEPVTPRAGSPVELQALWYQLLAHLSELRSAAGDDAAAQRWEQHAQRAGHVLQHDFWLSSTEYLADTLDPDGQPDASIRPNAVLAAAMYYSPLSDHQKASVVQLALAELLTPRGLRTLSPHDPRYLGRYEGGPEARDRAYHQGTVWPWLIGFLVEAALQVFPLQGARMRSLAQVVAGFEEHLSEHGLGHISEVFDGDPPHRPGGTPAQAWSVAEVLRAAHMLELGGS